MKRLFIIAGVLMLFACGRKTVPGASDVSSPTVPMSEEDLRVIEGDLESETVRAEEVEVPASKNLEPLGPHLLLTLQRTDCPGYCPVFEIRLFSDGRALYRGTKDVVKIGKYESRLSATEMEQVLREADQIRFFELKDNYPPYGKPIKELPTTITSINRLSNAKTVTNRYDAPRRLRSFEDYIIQIFEGLVWRELEG